MAESYYINYFGELSTIRLCLIVNPRHEIGLILLTIYQRFVLTNRNFIFEIAHIEAIFRLNSAFEIAFLRWYIGPITTDSGLNDGNFVRLDQALRGVILGEL